MVRGLIKQIMTLFLEVMFRVSYRYLKMNIFWREINIFHSPGVVFACAKLAEFPTEFGAAMVLKVQDS